MLKRLAVLVAGCALLAGCGGGSADQSEEPTTTPAPKVFTARQLKAALPKVEDVPRAVERSPRCPEVKDLCSKAQGVVVEQAVGFALDPLTTLSPEEQEKAGNAPSAGEVVMISATTFDSAEAAAGEAATLRRGNAKYVGRYTTKPKKREDGKYMPGLSGTGAVEDVSIKGWKGAMAHRSHVLTAPNGAKSRPMFDVVLSVSRGTTEISGTVVLIAEEREADAAVVLVKKIVSDYIQRLG